MKHAFVGPWCAVDSGLWGRTIPGGWEERALPPRRTSRDLPRSRRWFGEYVPKASPRAYTRRRGFTHFPCPSLDYDARGNWHARAPHLVRAYDHARNRAALLASRASELFRKGTPL